MKKSQILMSLLLVILLSSCYASRITYENLSIIQRGMSSKEVIAIMGKPSYRSFDEESEMLEFRTSESSIAGVVNIWFVDDRVTKMKSYHTNGCMDRNRAIEDKEEEESAKKEKKENPIPAAPIPRKGRYLGCATKIRITPIPRIIIAVLRLFVPTSPTIGNSAAIVWSINQGLSVFFFRLLILNDRNSITAAFANSAG